MSLLALGVATSALQFVGNIGRGKAEERAYEAEARKAEMQADLDVVARKRELNDALAMQAVMFGASGRQAGVGSAEAIQQEDIARAGEDIGLIKKGLAVTKSGYKTAAKTAKRSAISSGLVGSGKDMLSLYRAGAFSGKGK